MSDTDEIRGLIEAAFEDRARLTPSTMSDELDEAIAESLALLDSGAARVAEPKGGLWVVNEWLKKAVLLSFRTRDNELLKAGYTNFYDKVPLKYAHASEAQLRVPAGVRVVPPAVVRRGAYIAPNVVLMPSYVNIGAYVGSGHHGGHLGDGRLLRADRQERAPLRWRRHRRGAGAAAGRPTIIEDDCFIGARSEVVEGVIVEKGSVISMGVFIGQSTRIYDRDHGARSCYGRVPAGSVVVAGIAAGQGRHTQPRVRGDRQARGRPDAGEDLNQRAPARHRLLTRTP